MATPPFRVVPGASQFVSEPPPALFGNPPNSINASWSNANWLRSRFHFNFAEYSRGRPRFGVLRVMNDDLVQPSRGFGEHGHRDAEIATYVVSGELTHKDSLGTAETLGRGAVQFMTAGRGVTHSEHNRSASLPLRFIQMWLTPRASSLPPSYGSFAGDAVARRNAWAHLVGDVEDTASQPGVRINTDASIHVAELDAGFSLPIELGPARQAYLLVVEGTLTLGAGGGEVALAQHDGCELLGGGPLSIAAGPQGAHALLVTMAAA